MAEPAQAPPTSPSATLIEKAMLLGALALPWAFIRRGVDVTDQGYLLTIYRQFLHHPEAVGQAAHMWLTNELGGLWDAAFGGLGVIAHRAQWATCVSLGLLLAFTAARRVTSFGAAALAVLATAMFVVDRRETWFSYNSLTALINAAVVTTMVRGLSTNNRRLLVLSGALLGVSPFARFPNVLALSFALGPLFAALLDSSRRKRCLLDVAFVAGGVLLGAAVAVGAISAVGDMPVYRASLAGLFKPAVDQTGHGSSALLALFLDDQSKVLVAGIGTCTLLGALHWATLRAPVWVRVACFAAAAIAGVLGLVSVEPSSRDPERWRYFVVGVCYVGLLALALGAVGKSFELRCLALLAAGALLITPLGSDQGVKNAHWGLWVALPVLLATLLAAVPSRPQLRRLADVGALLVAVVTAEGAIRATVYTYRDAPRRQLTHSLRAPQLRGMLTTRERAQALDGAVEALSARVQPGDYLLTSESTPLFQYLTSTRPYLGIPWIMVDEDLAEIGRLLQSAPEQRGCLPVVVRARGDARSAKWPHDVRRGVDRKHAPARRLIASFLARHGYRVTWSNVFFEILEPASSVPGATACR